MVVCGSVYFRGCIEVSGKYAKVGAFVVYDPCKVSFVNTKTDRKDHYQQENDDKGFPGERRLSVFDVIVH